MLLEKLVIVNAFCRILAPAAYIFFASILPAVAFGEQLAQNTDGTLTVVQVCEASR